MIAPNPTVAPPKPKAQMHHRVSTEAGVAAATTSIAQSIEEGAVGTVAQVNRVSSDVMQVGFMGAAASAVLGFVGEVPYVGVPFKWLGDKIGGAVSKASTITLSDAAQAGSKVLEKSAAGIDHVAGAKATTVTNALRSGSSVVNGVEKKALDAIESLASPVAHGAADLVGSAGAKGVAGALRTLPQNAGKLTVMQVAQQSALATGSALSAYSTVKSYGDHSKCLRTMYADLTGKDLEKVSISDVFKSDAPESMQQARGSFFKTFGPQALLNGASIASNTYFMMGKGAGNLKGKAFIAQMAFSTGMMALGEFVGGNKMSAAQVYVALKDAHERGKEISPRDYGTFIAAANKDAAKSGGIENRLVQAMAIQYAEEKISPLAILHEMEDGKFNERAKTLQAEIKHRDAEAKLAKLSNGDHKQVVGKHTGTEMKRREQQTHGHAAGVA